MSRRWLMVVLAVGVCCAACAWIIAAVWHADQQELVQAKARWQHAPQHYQLDFTISGDELSGTFRAEVQQQQIVSITPITAAQPIPDVSLQTLTRVLPIEQLFQRVDETYTSSHPITDVLKRRSPLARWALERLGVARYPTCWQPTMERVRYDERWGYPAELSWAANPCDDGMFSLDRFDLAITLFRPLP